MATVDIKGKLENQRVNISAHTLTIKDENDKTRGMVRGVSFFDDWQPKDRFQFRDIIRPLMGGNILDDIFLYDGKVYYIVSEYALAIDRKSRELGYDNHSYLDKYELVQSLPGIETIVCARLYKSQKQK